MVASFKKDVVADEEPAVEGPEEIVVDEEPEEIVFADEEPDEFRQQRLEEQGVCVINITSDGQNEAPP